MIGKILMEKNKVKYRKFCKEERNLPFFLHDWWLDAVCGPLNWNVCLIEKGNEIYGVLPFYIRKKSGFTLLEMPQLTQHLGPYIKYPEGQKYYKKISWEKQVLSSLIDQLPKFDYFHHNFHYSITNWLPFYWKGFKSTLKYTYIIEDISKPEKIFNEFSHAKRKQIKKALKNDLKIIKGKISPEEFYHLHQQELHHEGKKINYSLSFLKNIYTALTTHGKGDFFVAIDPNNKIHGALLIVWDHLSGYDLISAINPQYASSGASSLLIFKVIEFLSKIRIKQFDFEGSMIEGVENSFRQFATTQKSYITVYKINSKLIKLKKFLQDLK
jgi:lipid II:glycine glycyltransferase (peptidoglycan interpeptide bridge formation enzyme)